MNDVFEEFEEISNYFFMLDFIFFKHAWTEHTASLTAKDVQLEQEGNGVNAESALFDQCTFLVRSWTSFNPADW